MVGTPCASASSKSIYDVKEEQINLPESVYQSNLNINIRLTCWEERFTSRVKLVSSEALRVPECKQVVHMSPKIDQSGLVTASLRRTHHNMGMRIGSILEAMRKSEIQT
jgi:hypothetical protein